VGLPLSDSQLGALRFVLIGALLVGLALWRPQGLLGRREAKGP
jgi:ABC-type branched-subunit amino acid transport system permease subunit